MQFQAVLTTILCIAWLMQPAFADAELAAYAREARIEIPPRNDSRAIRLPQLDFAVRAKFVCAPEAVVESVTISVADAYRRYAPTDGDDSLETTISVPASQIAPIAAGNFCANGNDDNEELLLSGVATAQLSLRCVADGTPSVSFTSLNLPLRLVCKTGEDQEPSAAALSPPR